jgi:hypothetical protein
MNTVQFPADLDAALDEAWAAAKDVPGFLLEQEARFLGMMAVCAPRNSVVVEIGSFKGKSTVLLGKLAQRYGFGPIVAIDPHTFHNVELADHRSTPGATSYDAFLKHLEIAKVANSIEVHRAFSSEVAALWNRPIGLLWIDGDHSYAGAKSDFDGFFPHVLPNGFVSLHDALHEFSGPIRVFIEDMLDSDRFGASGFVHSIAWSQFRPAEGVKFRTQRATLERSARRLLPFVADEQIPRGASKLLYKLIRSRVPRSLPGQQQWAAMLNRP